MADSTQPTIIEVYQRHGEAWAELRNKELVESSWLDRFSAMLPARGTVLDIGCGSGLPIGRELIRRGFDLTGVDGTPTMLSLFQRNLPGTPAHLIDMRELALGRRFSGLLAWDSFFHLSPADQRLMFERFQAHAEHGAALMFTSGNQEGIAIGDLEGDPLHHGSLNSDEYRALLDAARFDVVAHVVADLTCGGRTVWLAQQRP
ncbi:class I SAM-dependent DNA methyltransferase [Sphingomonas nostoxanthinifaciens]|uniref:class I SAM-dependent DNA methyltransferase n=1 Tax=Sphingomonas nostoxanthinifaciens TaxID=2872652 RepID=UPI001CC1C943|nr:class I SAM-dependent methyltransferase [Sphingomonas nostoxanthinifaciens]UAK25525.1 class I SAM-dependent methyltransferase [Sphingomonas nostoxanthinifaciens]